MASKPVFYVKWSGTGGLRLELRGGDTLRVEAANASIEFEPRAVLVEAPYKYKREIEDRTRRNLYIGFSEELKPVQVPRIDILGRSFVGNFEVIYTDLEFERYLTVITPASHLYDYAVITSRELMVQMPSKRKLYFEEEPYEKIYVYIV